MKICKTSVHRGAFYQFPFRWIYYYRSNESIGKETGKSHLCAVGRKVLVNLFSSCSAVGDRKKSLKIFCIIVQQIKKKMLLALYFDDHVSMIFRFLHFVGFICNYLIKDGKSQKKFLFPSHLYETTVHIFYLLWGQFRVCEYGVGYENSFCDLTTFSHKSLAQGFDRSSKQNLINHLLAIITTTT